MWTAKKVLKFIWKAILPIILFTLLIWGALGYFSYHYYNIWYNSVSKDEKINVFSWITQLDIILTDSGSIRRTGNTFMSIPEWYIVSISDDYTTWLEAWKNPSDFPYWQYLEDYWVMYGKITSIMDGTIARDYEYHTMVKVIGVSTTLEFWLKAIYESSIGYITSLFSWSTSTDMYYTHVSRKYVDFILLRPWYEFDYSQAISELKYDFSNSTIRSTERFCIYYIEFSIKKFYAKIIEDATHSSFAIPDIWTEIHGEFSTGVLLIDNKNIVLTKNGIKVSRYYPFTTILPKVITYSGSKIQDIAGNKKVVVEFISPISFWFSSIFSFPIPIDTSKKRDFLFINPENIASLSDDKEFKISHIYDF